MRHLILSATALLVGAVAFAAPRGANNRLSGDYVEARTASVFAGACHYGGEVTTTGRDAEMAWHIKSGAWGGVPLSGLTAMAAVTSDDNLSNESAARRSVLYIDAKATEAQARALRAALTDRYASSLGRIVAVRREPIRYKRAGEGFRVAAPGVGRLSVDAMPDRACCTQPNLVWYKPLVPVSERRVGYTRESGVHESALGVEWSKEGQNTAFYGTFTL